MEKTEEKYSSDEIKKFFGVKLKELRQDARMTRKQLADILNITEISVGNYERGLREPSLEKLVILSKLFDVSIEELIGYNAVSFKNKVIDNWHYNMLTAVILLNKFSIAKTIDGEFVLGNGFDLFRLIHSVRNTTLELSNEIVFFKSLKHLFDFVETLAFNSVIFPHTFKENFSDIINKKTKKDLNITRVYKQVSEELTSKLKDGQIYGEEAIWKNSYTINLYKNNFA